MEVRMKRMEIHVGGSVREALGEWVRID